MRLPFVNILKVKVTQSCPALCDPMDCSLPGSSVCEILQEEVLEWVALSLQLLLPTERGCAVADFGIRQICLIMLLELNEVAY